MPDWKPIAGVDIARLRARMLQAARDYFSDNDILMVDTPALSRAAVSDPNIESIAATVSLSSASDFYLHTSPEYAMKRLLADGFPDIAQICRVFRDAEAGGRHQPEFTMIEWYRLGFGLDDIMHDTECLIASVLQAHPPEQAPQRVSFCDAFIEYAGVDPKRCSVTELADIIDADTDLRAAVGEDRDAWLDLVLATHIAPQFDPARLTTLHHYPRSQAALARICPTDPAVADRFEIFCGDIELANGYVELTDANEQRERFDHDQASRQRRGASVRPIDTQLLAALHSGLPPCAGVAVGFDRLVMINAGTNDMRRTLHFPFDTEQ